MQSVANQSMMTERIETFVDRYGHDQADGDSESRRQCTRFTMVEPVDILLDLSETPAEVVLATGRDVSTTGMGVYMNHPVEPGTNMIVSVDNEPGRFQTKATVVHSTLSVGLYKVGMRFVI